MKTKHFLLYSSITAALSGFLFGFDTVVISGAEQSIQELWNLSSFMHGLAVSTALWGTVLGAFTGRLPTEKWGRVNTLVLVGWLYFLSAIGSALAQDVFTLISFRFIGGLAIGISTIAAPMYLAEISPAEKRGRLAGLFQCNIVMGILIAYASNALLANLGDVAWRYMLGIQALPSLAFVVMAMKLDESPRWLLLRKNDPVRAKEILSKLNPDLRPEDIIAIVDEITHSPGRKNLDAGFFTKTLLRPILLAFCIAMFNQLSGINAVLYFAPRIFEMSGLKAHAALIQSVGIGLVNLVFTLAGLWLIDRLGRKKLLTIGAFGYILSLGLCSWAFSHAHYSIVPYCLFAFIASHAIGQGTVIWVFISEIFPNHQRDNGQSLGSFTHWIFAALLTLVFPHLVESFSPAALFGGFCAFMILQLFWIWRWVPETKGIPLEVLEKQLQQP